MIIKNKRGMEKVVAIYWFAILILVAAGFFAAVYTFYSSPYDVRELEANVLINRVADCLSSEGKLNEKLFKDEKFSEEFKSNFKKECNLNFDTFESEFKKEEMQYYVKVNFYDFNEFESPEKSKSLFEIVEGNKNLVSDCKIQEKENNEYGRVAKCSEKILYSLGENDKGYFVKIFSIIRKTEKNAS
jgi:hypothetical protein